MTNIDKEQPAVTGEELSRPEAERRINATLVWLQGQSEDAPPPRRHPSADQYAFSLGVNCDEDYRKLRAVIATLPTEHATVALLRAAGVDDTTLRELLEYSEDVIEQADLALMSAWKRLNDVGPAANPKNFVSAQDTPKQSSALANELPAPKSSQEAGDSEEETAGLDIDNLYGREAKREPLLSAEEEIELAKIIEAGLFADKLLQDGEEAWNRYGATREELERIADDGRRAKERFVRANLRLVMKNARSYMGRGLELNDLVQEGNMGLMHAIEKYDYALGYKFSTYATNWIKQSMSRAVANHGTAIRVPVHMFEAVRRLHAVTAVLSQEGVEPSDEKIATHLGWSLEKLGKVRQAKQKLSVASLNTPIGENDTELGDLIEDDQPGTDAKPIRDSALTALTQVLDTLPEREHMILCMRYGLGGHEPHTLEALGSAIGVSRERVRQVEAKVISKLRHPSRSYHLRSLVRD